ncbi:hypothetical protein G0Q06_10810 [Puniceicoccales bacterium CK1056]|uniref:Phosphodiester glycosidase domain-containing protein n=1 Tax=Oceanipulchritudo coccoides TaxID=2706888 RepID=A0A6B2M2H3_9BACT|nr:hypothetical protein [Oceanipulchritudo coccoides]NDV62943.1 hypothetical protein [Oceanipulchritudo coccoides]
MITPSRSQDVLAKRKWILHVFLMHKRRWLKRAIITGLLGALFLVGLYFLLKPGVTDRREIFHGVYLTVEELEQNEQGSGKAMIVEVHWDTPGVKLRHRPFSFEPDPDDPEAPIYRLEPADLGLLRHGASVLVNSTRYLPEALYRSFPGAKVRSVETLVVDGKMSHLHKHSYLMYWDKDGNAHQLVRKPPTQESIEEAVLAMGIQGVQVWDRKAHYRALGDRDLLISRTFIGIDTERHILWLMAFENVSGYRMIDRAVELGMEFGGQMDSGDGTSLLIGSGAKDLLPHTGIRFRRPLGPYLMVDALPLD